MLAGCDVSHAFLLFYLFAVLKSCHVTLSVVGNANDRNETMQFNLRRSSGIKHNRLCWWY